MDCYGTILLLDSRTPESPLRGMFLVWIKFGCHRRTFVSNKTRNFLSQCLSKSSDKKATITKGVLGAFRGPSIVVFCGQPLMIV